jgi:hypothetical protein
VARPRKRVGGLVWGADDHDWVAFVDGYRIAEVPGVLRVGARERDRAICGRRGQEQHHGERKRESDPETCLRDFCLIRLQVLIDLENVMDESTYGDASFSP